MSDNQQFCLRWNNHQSTLVQVIDSLLSSGVLVDCTLAAEGQYLHAHKVVLCACSPYLETLLSQHYEKHPIVILKDVKFQELKSMMDYMYKGEVNISQDQLGQFLKAAESLQIKGLTDGGGGENDAKDVGTSAHNKRHDPPPIRKSVPPNQSRSSVVLPSHSAGLTIEPSKRTIPSHLSESQPDSPIRSREGSSSPTPRKRRRPRRPSQGDDDGHQDNCDLPMQQQSILNTVPIIPQLPAGSSSTITKAPPPDDEPDQPAESDVRLAESGLLKEKIEPQSELLIEPKTEYMEETNNDDSVEDLTLDDDDEYDNMDGAGPSHGGDNSNQSYGQWQMGERTHDDVFMAAQEAVGGGPRDSQARITITKEQSRRLQKLLREKPAGRCKYTDEEIRRNASRFKIPAPKIRHFLRLHNALAEGSSAGTGAVRRVSHDVIDNIEKARSGGTRNLLSTLSFDKKVQLLRMTASVTKPTSLMGRELSRELNIQESRVFNWLRGKAHRNQTLKKSLSVDEAALLDEKLADFDYLDDDSALVLADRFNVSCAVIKKAFLKRKPNSVALSRPVVELKKYQIPDSVTVTAVPSTTTTPVPTQRRTKAAVIAEITEAKHHKKTQQQKNILFEAFRESPAMIKMNSAKMMQLEKATGLSKVQLAKWLSIFREKWSNSNESGLKKLLTSGFTADQVLAYEKTYKETRFLNLAQMIELSQSTGVLRSAINAWFTHRRLYEVHSRGKDLVKIEQQHNKTSTAKNESNEMRMLKPSISIPQSSIPALQPEDQPQMTEMLDNAEANEFFDSLDKDQKAYLLACTKNFSSSYKKISKALNLPESKVALFIRSYRLSHALIRQQRSSLPERVQKALLNHYLKYGKLSTKTSVMLSKRLKVHPNKILNWNKQHMNRLQKIGLLGKKQSDVEPSQSDAEVAEYDDDTATEPVVMATTSKTESPSPPPARQHARYHFTTADNKTMLFNEFKKSPQGAANKSKQLAQATKLTAMQVRKWLYNFGKKISEQKKSKVEANLNNAAISAEARARLVNEFKTRKFLEEYEVDSLAAEFGLLRKHVTNWFVNARYYEILTGQCPGSVSSAPKRPAASKPAQVAAKPPPVVKFVYEELDPETQARLSNELESYPFEDKKLTNLADELQIPSVELKKWFESASRCTRSRRRSSVATTNVPSTNNTTTAEEDWFNLTTKQMQTLLSEFEADPNLTEERTVNMAKRIKLTKERIRAWFEHRRLELRLEPTPETVQTVPPIKIIMPKWSSSGQEMPSVAPQQAQESQSATGSKKASKSSKKSYEFKVPNQLNMLFEEFKQSPQLTNDRLIEISDRTNLSSKQITNWFNWLNQRLSALPRENLLEENRNKYLSLQQIEILEQYYVQCRYMNRPSREALSVELGVPKAVIKSWFESRRNYELLCENDEQPAYFTEEYRGGIESVLDYDYDDEDESTAVVDDSVVNFEPQFDPLMDSNYPAATNNDVTMEEHSYSFQLEPNSQFLEDLTSLPYEPRQRFITPLDKDLEPIEEDIEKIFWILNKSPTTNKTKCNQDIDEAKNRILENEFSKNPWIELGRISQLSEQLLVSEAKLHWWFMKKRCFLTKTILTIPPPQPKSKPKNVTIDLTDDDQPASCGQFEFVTAEEVARIKEEVPIEHEPLAAIESDTLENGDDPFENNALDDESLNSEEFSLQIPVESTNDSNSQSTTAAASSSSPPPKKKKKRLPLTSHQRAVLRKELKANKDISIVQVRLLAQDLGLTVPRIQAWFETMRKSSSAPKKPKVGVTVSVKNLDPELESALEAEYSKSANFSDKRAKMIALRLKTNKKLVKKWFVERAKKNDSQTKPMIMNDGEPKSTEIEDDSTAIEKEDELAIVKENDSLATEKENETEATERDESMETEKNDESMETANSDLSTTETEKNDEESMTTQNETESMETENSEESTTTTDAQ